MIKLIVGKKGSGKTKILLDQVKEAVSHSNGDVVFIDNSDQHTFELNHKVRLINAVHYDCLLYTSRAVIRVAVSIVNWQQQADRMTCLLKFGGNDFGRVAHRNGKRH